MDAERTDARASCSRRGPPTSRSCSIDWRLSIQRTRPASSGGDSTWRGWESLGTRLAERRPTQILPRRLQVQGRDRSRRRSPGQRRSGRDAQAVHVPPERPQPGSRPGEPADPGRHPIDLRSPAAGQELYVVISGANHFTSATTGRAEEPLVAGNPSGIRQAPSRRRRSLPLRPTVCAPFSTRTSREQVFRQSRSHRRSTPR